MKWFLATVMAVFLLSSVSSYGHGWHDEAVGESPLSAPSESHAHGLSLLVRSGIGVATIFALFGTVALESRTRKRKAGECAVDEREGHAHC